ncbi:MAG TPA: hypothetical protein VFZ01_01095 [Geminicoccaceae bacterium]
MIGKRVLGLAAGFALAASTVAPVQAASDVGVGGYHDEILRAAHQDLLGAGRSGADGGIRITVDTGGPSVLSSSFTPRFGRYGFGGPGQGDVDLGSLLKQSYAPDQFDTSTRGMRIGSGEGAEVAGFEIGWAASAEVTGGSAAPAGTETFMLGGELAVSGVRVDAAFGEDPGVFGLDGRRMTAGVGYALGPIDARVGYSLIEDEASLSETSLFTLGSQLALRPGLVVQGDLAYAEGESGAPATAGLLSLRLSF